MGMGQTLHIHIGHYKTGTTAIQAFLARNRAALLAAGLDYAGLGMALDKHNVFAVPLIYGRHKQTDITGHDGAARPREFWDPLLDYVRDSAAPDVLVSSEEFIRIGEDPACTEYLERVARRAGEDIRLRAIAYLRPPGSHLESWYNQLVKLNRPIGHRARSITRDFDRVNLDYARALRPWVEVLGPENVTVRGYRSEWRGGDLLYRDFLSLFGQEMDPAYVLPEGDPNPRIDDRSLELVRVMNRLGVPEQAIAGHVSAFEDWLAANPQEDGITEQDMAAARREALSGLDWIAALPDAEFDLQAFKADPPRIRPETEDFSAAVLEYAVSVMLGRAAPPTSPPAPAEQEGTASTDARTPGHAE